MIVTPAACQTAGPARKGHGTMTPQDGTIAVIGAGVGRTGTHSLKLALERLLGGTCHHMLEVFAHPDEVPVWHAAAEGRMPDWQPFLAG
jgi:hypothetical protein